MTVGHGMPRGRVFEGTGPEINSRCSKGLIVTFALSYFNGLVIAFRINSKAAFDCLRSSKWVSPKGQKKGFGLASVAIAYSTGGAFKICGSQERDKKDMEGKYNRTLRSQRLKV